MTIRFRQPRRRRWAAPLTALTAAVLLASGTAVAHPDDDGAVSDGAEERDTHQHGSSEGHLAPVDTPSVELVSKLALRNVEPEKIADVGVHNGYAYLAAWGQVSCGYNGVHVVDINDPANPEEVAFIGAKQGSYPGEGVQALSISTPKFTGDILVTNNEKCNARAGFGGMNIYDVTNPEHPTPLAKGVGDSTVGPLGTAANGAGKKAAHSIHSVFAWDAGAKAYAVIVDNEEGYDVDIMDITDPKKATLIAEYDLDLLFPQIRQAAPPNLIEVFLHDMIVKEIGGRQVMLLSYWDAGYVKLDVTNPLAPTYLGDTDFTNPDPEAAESGLTVWPEGNGHQAEFTMNNQYVIGADEDFDPYVPRITNVTDRTPIIASLGSDTRPLETGRVIQGQTVFVGRACPGDPGVPAGSTDPTVIEIAVVERGVCTFTEKVAAVIAAGGYDAVLVVNRTGDGGCNSALGMSVEGAIVTVGVAPRKSAYSIFDIAAPPYDDAACLADTTGAQLPVTLGKKGDTLRIESQFDGWGYVHLFANTGGKMAELDTYAIDEAHDPTFASGFGDLSVHEVATSREDPARAYYAYYSGGFRVTEIQGNELVETGAFIDAGGSNLWGVEVFEDDGVEYVAASDRDYGLYIFKYTPQP